MSTHKKIDVICIAAIIFTVALTALFANGKALGITVIESEDAGSGMFTSNDLDASWDTSSATRITLSDNGSVVSGNGAYAYGGDVYIVYAGRYVLSGELTDGSVIVNANKNDKIWISLDGVSLHCGSSAAIRVEQAGKVFLTLADGTENMLSSGEEYDAEIAASGVDGVIYSRDDLTINGNGTLIVDAAYKHGIVCNDDLVITGGSITVNAVQDCFHANDSVRIKDAVITASAGDDGITVSNDDETSFLYVESGSITIPACYEGLEAVSITIAGGTIDISPADDGINACGSGVNSVIRVTGGDIRIVNPDGRDADGLDSNGSIYIEGGRVFVSVSDNGNCAIDYGTENGGECLVSGGTVIACGGSMMAEGFDAASTQGFLMHNTLAAAGTAVALTDSDGRELLSEVIPCSFSSVVLSTPEMKVGDRCTVSVGDSSDEVTIDNAAASSVQAGMFKGGMGHGRGDMSAGQQPPGDSPMGGPQGMEPPEGQQSPDGMEPPDGMQIPDGMEPPEDMPDGGKEMGGQSPQDAGGRQEARFPQQDMRQMGPGGDAPSSGVSVETAALLGISALVLLIGLFVAVKVKH